MEIKWDSTWLTSATAPSANVSINGQRVIEEAHFLRANAATFFSRRNASLRLSFDRVWTFNSVKAAEQFLLSHWGTLSEKASLTLRVGLTSETQSDVICQNAVLEAVEFPQVRGVAVTARYRFAIPEVTGITTTPTDDEVTSGTASISSGVATVSVTGLGLSVPPVQVLCQVRKPSGGYNLVASPVDGTYTTDGFDANLSGLTDSANYKLDYILLF